MSSSWHTLLIRIGERCMEYGGHADAEDHIETCYNYITRELQQSGDEILEVLMQCAEELPHKDPLYGTLVGLISMDDGDFASKVVQKTQEGLQDALYSGNCNKLRILMRFLSVLMSSNVVSTGSVVEVFETLLSSAATTVDDEKGNPAWQPRADFYIYCILASLPWCGLELYERVAEELERVMAGVEAYLSIRRPLLEVALCPFSSIQDDDMNAKEDADFLVDLWRRIKDLQDNGWKVESVPRPHLAFEARLATCQGFEFGQLICPESPELPSTGSEVEFGKQRQEAEQKYPQRMRRIHIFPPSKTDEEISLIDRFVVEEYLLDVLFYLNGCRKECAAYMAGLPVPFRYEFLMAETVFSQLLLLPKPPFMQIYYTVVIIDLCKALPGAFPTVVAGAVRWFFNRVGDLDVECRTRLILWFAHHLSNFQFVWPWEEWAHVMDQPKWSPQRVFVQEALEKEVRLAYLDKIRQSLDAAPKLEELLPPKNSPCFKYSAENHANFSDSEIALSTELTGMVKGKKTARDIQLWIEEKIMPTYGQKAAIEIVIQTLLYIGSKSFTHMVTVLERYGQVFSKLASDQNLQVFMIEEVAKMWQNSSQMTSIIIDRMMGYRIISNLAIVSWVFSSQNVQRFHTSDAVWEVLRNAINKTNNRTADLRKEVDAAQKVVEAATDAANKAMQTLQSAEAILDAAETEESQMQATAKAEWAKSLVEKKKDDENLAEEALEAKDALLTRALREQEALLVAVFRNFSSLLTERLSNAMPISELELVNGKDTIDVDQEGPSPMDTDDNYDEDDKEINDKRHIRHNGISNKEDSGLEEEQQWRICTLGNLRAITRQYAEEVWEHIKMLDAEVLKEDVDPVVLKTVFACLQRPWS
eukprot:c28555_g2_i4 orf=271-2889(+)